MIPHVFVVGVVSALIGAALGWFMAWRYGRRRALVVPVLAVVASVASVCRASGLDPAAAMGRAAIAMAFAGPAVVGALAGMLLARHRG